MNNIDKLKSTCCRAKVTVAGDDLAGDHYWICEGCSKACDIWFPKLKKPKTIEMHKVKHSSGKNHVKYISVPNMTGVWEEEWKEIVKLNFDGLNGEAYGINEIEAKVRSIGIIFIDRLLTKQQEQFKGNTKRIAYQQGYNEANKEIIERLEELNKTFQTDCRKYQQYGGLGHDIRTCDCGLYNQAIDDAIRIIKEK